jgi:predicted metal-dependent hydrolase
MKENFEQHGQFRRGVELFNGGEYFESHEVWEELWLEASGDERIFLQGLIQVAAALHHFGRGNLLGMRSLLAAGLIKLDGFPAVYYGIDLARMRDDAREWVGREDQVLSLPRIGLVE